MIKHAPDCDEHDFTQCPNFKRLVENLAEGGSLHIPDHPAPRSRRPQEGSGGSRAPSG
jgi:hypothetical protein